MRTPLRTACALLVCLSALACEQSIAQKRSRTESPASSVRSWQVPKLTRDTLPNGLQILHARVNDLPLVEINVMVNAGSVADPDSLHGLAMLTGKLLFSGTDKLNRTEISAEIARLGASISTYTAYEYSQIYLRTLSKNLRRSLDILADICSNTRFSEFEFQAEKKKLLSGLSVSRRNQGEEATRILLELLFGENHGLSRTPSGSVQGLEGTNLADALRFYESKYRPENTVIVIVGGIDYRSIKVLLADRFGKWEKRSFESDAVTDRRTHDTRITVVDDSSSRFAQIRAGVRIPNRSDAAFPSLLVMNQALGGGRDSRLYRSLGLRHRVAGSFFSSIGAFKEGGWLIINGSAPAARADSVLMWVEETMRSIATTPLSDAELESARRGIAADYPLSFATNRSAHEQLIDAVLFGLAHERLQAFPREVESASAEDVIGVAERVFVENRFAAVIRGDAKQFLPALQARYGDRVTVIRPLQTGDQQSEEQ